MTRQRREWLSALALGLWLSVALVWPAAMMPLGRTQLLWQPLLVISLLVMTLRRARRIGWKATVGQSLLLYVVMTLAGWLPSLRTILSTPEFHYPSAYRYYLALYETGLAALVGFLAGRAALGRDTSWWPAGPWSRPLVVAPLVLMGRALWFGHWLSPLIGLMIGLAVAARRPGRPVSAVSSEAVWKSVPAGLVVFALLAVWASGMWFYLQLGLEFPQNSDDGPGYYRIANEIATDPRRIWTPPAIEDNMFTGYLVLMGLWFRLVGPHIPLWLIWQGLAAGLLAVMVYRLGQVVGSRAVGAIAAILVVLDHVILHLMATLNMEVFFIPTLYAALYLWASVDAQHPGHLRRCFLAGLVMGVAMLFRPTTLVLPFALIALLCCERPRPSVRQMRAQGLRLLTGFALPLAVLLVRHRLAWGWWTLGGAKTIATSWRWNYAWKIQGQHPVDIGLGPWLKLFTEDPSVLWREMIPNWWAFILQLWTHQGFGQMDFVRGLNYPGFYQAALSVILALGVIVGIGAAVRRRARQDLVTLLLPAYCTMLAIMFWVANTRYRAPLIPALYLLCCAGFSAIARAIRSRAKEPRVLVSP
ncbi:MAG: glycosyltransferase family 39 protein [Candidatus Omnitrophica bacterium]|nr:glycosyltransferase family 39 protein [Candidatus Omnitrophota bacterium]